MIHYTCDCCKRSIDPERELRYVVRVEVYAAIDNVDDDGDDERDHLQEIQDILERLDDAEDARDRRRRLSPGALRPVQRVPRPLREKPARPPGDAGAGFQPELTRAADACAAYRRSCSLRNLASSASAILARAARSRAGRAGFPDAAPRPAPTQRQLRAGVYEVERVVDGDTLLLRGHHARAAAGHRHAGDRRRRSPRRTVGPRGDGVHAGVHPRRRRPRAARSRRRAAGPVRPLAGVRLARRPAAQRGTGPRRPGPRQARLRLQPGEEGSPAAAQLEAQRAGVGIWSTASEACR